MNKRYIGVIALSVLLMACGSPVNKKDIQEANVEIEPVAEFQFYGSEISTDGAKSLNELAGLLEGQDSVHVLTSGKIKDVCSKKGCWMTFDLGEDQDELMVRFKDYGFFVPMDCAGKTATFKGMVFRDTISVADLQHYAEDAGKSAEEIALITEPKYTLSFEATGVALKN